MKRIALLLVLCLTIVMFSACGVKQEDPTATINFPQANFNNNYWFSGGFWALDDNIFYLQDGFYNMGAYWSTDGSRDKLFEESDFASDSTSYTLIGDIFVLDQHLYFELITDRENWLYRYDLMENTYAPICEIPNLYRWVVAGDYFIYREHPTNNSEKHSALWIYNLQDGNPTQVCANVEEFGIVDGQLRYITHGDTYQLYQYDYANNNSAFLGAFSPEFDDEYDIFNFTANAVVMFNWGKELDQNLVVYTLSSDSTAVYTLPRGIHSIVAYDQYAYAVIYDTLEYASTAVPSEDNGIYRIDLTDGSYEVVDSNADDDTKIHVVSDDRIYIIQREMNGFFRSGRHVYKFDYMTRTKERITAL